MEPEHDFHAGMIETSLMMYWKPKLIQEEICMDDEYNSKIIRTDQDWFEKREKPINHPFIVEKVGQCDEIKVGVKGSKMETRELINELAVFIAVTGIAENASGNILFLGFFNLPPRIKK